MDNDDDLIQALRPVERAFNQLDIGFFVGGSVASSFRGAMRSTMDVDLVADISQAHVQPLLSIILDQYYASAPALTDAIERKGCFNLIHLATSFKIDVFVTQQRTFDKLAFERASLERIGSDEESLLVPVATVEDIMLAKLNWYRLGGEVSERQWDDLCRLLKLHKTSLEWIHLETQARLLGVTDLLERLRKEIT